MTIADRAAGPLAVLLALGSAGSASAQGGDLLTPTQEAKLKASDGSAGDFFGSSVALSGDTAVIGAELDDLTVDFPLNEGTAYVLVRSGTSWTEQAKLIASDAGADDAFGGAVAVSGDTAVIGAWSDDHAADHIGGTNAGSAYVFARSGATWNQQAKLTASDASMSDEFGVSVSVSGDTVVIGAPFADPNGLDLAGSAYVFVRIGTSWIQQARLAASDAEAGDLFGISVSVSDETVVVGASQDDHSGLSGAGSAYVFVRSGTRWTEQARLSAGDASNGDTFGVSVDVSGDTAVVGADDSDQHGKAYAGSAYIFVRSGTSWSRHAKLTASDVAALDHFGNSVSVAGDIVVVGASRGDVGAQTDAGAAYLFVRTGTSWSQQAKLTASGAAKFDYFGDTVAVCGDTALVGGPDDENNNGILAGAAYVFTFGGFTDLGDGLAGVAGIPKLAGTGTLVVGSGGALTLSSAQPAAASALFASLADNPTPFKGGTFHAVPALLLVPATTSPEGGWTLPWEAWPAGLPAGTNLFLQSIVPDAQAVQGFALSNVLKATQP